MADHVSGIGTREDPWRLKTPSGQADIEAYRDEDADPPELAIIAAKTEVPYLLRSITDLHAMPKSTVDGCRWVPPTSRSLRLRAPSKHGLDRRRIRSAAGMG